jgi:hypothetical protein
MGNDILMVFCLGVACGTALAADSGLAGGAVTSEVRADRRTGRLVRRVVVTGHPVVPRVIVPVTPSQGFGRSERTSDIHTIVNDVSSEHGVDPLLVHAIIKQESAYNPYALSPKGAQGLMQLIPSTAQSYGVTNVYDQRQNVEGGVKFLKHLMSRFEDMRLVLAAYNAGENAVVQYRGIPPYEETQEYVYRVGRNYGQLRRASRTGGAAAPPVDAELEHRPLETFVDEEGRVHLRTR